MTTIDVRGRYIVGSDEVLSFIDEPGFDFQMSDDGSISTLVNNGDVSISSTTGVVVGGIIGSRHAGPVRFWNRDGAILTIDDGYAVALSAGGSTVRNDGLIRGSGDGAFGISAQAIGRNPPQSRVLNFGTITMIGNEDASGIADGGDIRNSGEISASAGGIALGVEVASRLINTGQIRVEGGTLATAILAGPTSIIHNDGQIVAVSHGAIPSEGIGLISYASDLIRIVNAGQISADQAILGQEAAPRLVLHNSGQIIGDILAGQPGGVIVNTGSIIGDIALGLGRDVYSGAHGQLHGIVQGLGGDDVLRGGDEADTFYGDQPGIGAYDGADLLRGGGGDDTLYGGGGADTLWGGLGADQLTGGTGDNLFRFTKLADSLPSHADLITDLHSGDTIDLSRIDADQTHAGNQAFVRESHFTGHAGELIMTFDGTETLIQADTNGDGQADFVIRITGDHTGFSGLIL